MSKSTSRHFGIDGARALAMIGMVIFHAAFDLDLLGVIEAKMFEGAWLILARVVQITFMFTTGMTLVLAYEKRRAQGRWEASVSRLKHAVKLSCGAALVSLSTWILFQDQAIWFGVLHFYAIAVILGLPFLRFKQWNVVFGLGVLVLAFMLRDLDLGVNPLAYVLGLGHSRAALDYFPLLPWFGVFLLGMGAGPWLLRDTNAKWSVPERLKFWIHFLTKRGLWIYLIHQPLLILAIELLF